MVNSFSLVVPKDTKVAEALAGIEFEITRIGSVRTRKHRDQMVIHMAISVSAKEHGIDLSTFEIWRLTKAVWAAQHGE